MSAFGKPHCKLVVIYEPLDVVKNDGRLEWVYSAELIYNVVDVDIHHGEITKLLLSDGQVLSPHAARFKIMAADEPFSEVPPPDFTWTTEIGDGTAYKRDNFQKIFVYCSECKFQTDHDSYTFQGEDGGIYQYRTCKRCELRTTWHLKTDGSWDECVEERRADKLRAEDDVRRMENGTDKRVTLTQARRVEYGLPNDGMVRRKAEGVCAYCRREKVPGDWTSKPVYNYGFKCDDGSVDWEEEAYCGLGCRYLLKV